MKNKSYKAKYSLQHPSEIFPMENQHSDIMAAEVKCKCLEASIVRPLRSL